MPLTGLSNQWKSYDGLLRRFASSYRGPLDNVNPRYDLIVQLLEALHESCSSMIYVGTSQNSMNFSTDDAESVHDRTQPFAYVNLVETPGKKNEYKYFVKTRTVAELRPNPQWEIVIRTDVSDVVRIIMDARRKNG